MTPSFIIKCNHARSYFAPPFSTILSQRYNGPKMIIFFLKFKSIRKKFYFRNYDDINFYFFLDIIWNNTDTLQTKKLSHDTLCSGFGCRKKNWGKKSYKT